uniref:Uncharacterized protein n=1 Tax=Anopheles coluzzii TaxID=1518534 RepID=A0A8W7PZ36_ANOCL
MSDNEHEGAAAPLEPALDSVPYATVPLVPPVDSSIATIVLSGRLEGTLDATAVVGTPPPTTVAAESLGAFVQPLPASTPHRLQLFRYPNAFARPPHQQPHHQHHHPQHHHHHLPATINKHEPKRACTSLPLYLSKRLGRLGSNSHHTGCFLLRNAST